MNFVTQIKCTAAALALFAAIGFTALTYAETGSKPTPFDVVQTAVEIATPAVTGAEVTKTARVHVGTPVMVKANPTAEDIRRASR